MYHLIKDPLQTAKPYFSHAGPHVSLIEAEFTAMRNSYHEVEVPTNLKPGLPPSYATVLPAASGS